MEISVLPIAKLAFVDKILDEYKDDMGGLPESIKVKESEILNAKKTISETEQILSDIQEFVATAKKTLVSLKEREDKLTKQQFLVRNNKESDLILTEINNIKNEHGNLSAKMRSEGRKEENLLQLLEKQKQALVDAEEELISLHKQYELVAEEQGDDTAKYTRIRKKLKLQVDEALYDRYSRIRMRITDAAVTVKRDSCTGCYRAIPKQIIVEMRNQPNRIFECEHCGRLLIPEWVEVKEEDLE